MRRSILGILVVVLMLMGLSPAHASDDPGSPPPAPRVVEREVPAFQTASNRQYKTMKFAYTRLCPSCTAPRYTSNNFPKATGKVKVVVTSYRIGEKNYKYDFFLIDAIATLTDRTGDEDWGWMDIRLQNKGKVKVVSSSYTLGKENQNTTTCKRYPVNLGLEFFGVSAGTTTGHVSLCNPGSKVASSSVSRGRLYHATGLSGLKSIQMQRYVRVKQGARPQFRVVADRNTEYSNCSSGADGYFCYIVRAMSRKSLGIGTTPQR
jgi:hypothetical protein